ncbi:MAG: DUF4340 domain-containing protein, partial [Deltaproteobacteria bacterium]|nr:DUF4340 domain-containing protein [Deltaproteobacteria bacterium]
QLVLPNPEYYLEVYLKEKSSPLRLEIGRDAYGDNQRYGYRPDTERVYLFPSAELDKLARNPSQMMERRLFTVNPPQMDRVEVLMAGTTQVMYRLTGRMGWNDAADAADNNTEMERFVIMLGRLSTEAYLPDEKVPPSGSPALRMEVRLFRGKESEPVEWLRLWGQLPGGARAVSSLSGLAVSLSDSVVNPLLQAQEALGKGR